MIFDSEHKVAVATEDGRTIAEHFGSAPLFAIYTVRRGKVQEEELRVNRRECSRNMDDIEAGCWELMEQLLPDVRVVICRGMGENAYVGLLRRDVLPITTEEDKAVQAITAYLRNRLKDDPERVHHPRRDREYGGNEEMRTRTPKGDAKDLDYM